MSGTLASVVTEAFYAPRRPPQAVRTSPATCPGLHYDYYEGRWQDLFSRLERLKPVKSGKVEKLFDISPKGTAPTYAFKYTGYFEAPADGVYNFYAPPEYYEPSIMAGYELRLFLDGKVWYPATSRHALGTWSVALQRESTLFACRLCRPARGRGAKDEQARPEAAGVGGHGADGPASPGPDLPEGPLSARLFSHAK